MKELLTNLPISQLTCCVSELELVMKLAEAL